MRPKMRTWTVDEMLAERPCTRYLRPRIAELWSGRERLSLLDRDKIWVCCRDHPHRAPWLEQIVARAIEKHALRCRIPRVESWARRWLSGEDRSAASAWASAWASAEAAWAAWAATLRQQLTDMRSLLSCEGPSE